MTTIFRNSTTAVYRTTRIPGNKNDLTGTYIGVSVGCVFGGILIFILCILYVKKVRNHSKVESPSSRPIQQRSKNYIIPNPQLPKLNSTSQPPVIRNINETVCIQSNCLEFLRQLNIHKGYFESKYNRCYCLKHYSRNKSKTYHIGGYDYTIPWGWMRFGLKCSFPPGENEDFFQNWATSYYGTSIDQLENILRNRFIPFSGDNLINNKIYSPKFDDPNHCYTSPSIYYTSGLKVCEQHMFYSQSNEIYQVQIILQCKQKPNTFEVTNGRSDLCQIIPNHQIKWKTSARSTIIPYGLMIRMVKQ